MSEQESGNHLEEVKVNTVDYTFDLDSDKDFTESIWYYGSINVWRSEKEPEYYI